MKDLVRILALLAPAILVGCGAFDSPQDTDVPEIGDLSNDVCTHAIQDRVLHIDQASGTVTGATIGEVRLNTFTVNGMARTAEEVSRVSTNVGVDGPDLICTLPCSMGYYDSEWIFTAEAPGFDPTLQELSAEYATVNNGCQGYSDNGTHASITLDEPP